jgi:hypothetical protein
VRIIHGTLRSVLAEAVRDELVERDVANVVRNPSVPQQLQRVHAGLTLRLSCRQQG